ncbi:hypothetical protein GGI43DRAFT_73039 [Trichoderma evansii]
MHTMAEWCLKQYNIGWRSNTAQGGQHAHSRANLTQGRLPRLLIVNVHSTLESGPPPDEHASGLNAGLRKIVFQVMLCTLFLPLAASPSVSQLSSFCFMKRPLFPVLDPRSAAIGWLVSYPCSPFWCPAPAKGSQSLAADFKLFGR